MRTQRRWTSYFEFDCVTRTWTELPSSVASRSGHTAAILHSGRLSIVYGRRSSAFDVQPVPVSGLPRSQCPALTLAKLKAGLGAEPCKAPAGRTHQAAWSNGSLLVVHGGQLLDLAVSINKNLESEMYAYDDDSKMWFHVPGGSGLVRTGAQGFLHGRRMYLVCGEDYSGCPSRVMYIEL